MVRRRRFIVSTLAFVAALGLTTGCDEAAKQRVLLISLDGFRWDYRDRFDTPSLDALAAAGVSAAKMQPGFPSKTFPNHFTLVTGLVPDHHGVVSNTMRDPAIPGVTFSMSNRDAVVDPRWWQAEPIWTTLEKQGRKTAPLLWPGSEAPSGGVRPTHWMAYVDRLTDAERIALLAKVYSGPESEWPDFATLYWPSVDQASHDGGPLSPEVRAVAERVDGALGELHKTLAALGVLDSLNVIVVSDHGMSEQSRERVIYLEDYIDLATIDIVDGSPIPGVYPKGLPLNDVYARLAGRHPHLQVYRRHEIPARLQFGTHPRVPPILLLAGEGWSVFPQRQEGRRFSLGAHGYDNALESMQALFVAAGPAFERGVRLEQIRSVDVYEVMCAILGITPNRNDGDPSVARRLLR
ncbi:MAG: ectonucleotide pyrophosphatase/phosphodiesterase [Acidobacteriota bacterium]|nr:ectonucleotide pyrophosphatase/phosphodiesterase [Acidobacteriota bacterium]